MKFILGMILSFAFASPSFARTSAAFISGTDKKPITVAVTVPDKKNGLSVAIGGKEHKYNGKLRYLAFHGAMETELGERSGDDNEPIIGDVTFNNVLVAIVGDQLIYYDGKTIDAYDFPALKEILKPGSQITVQFDESEKFDFYIRVTNGGDGRVFVFKNEVLWASNLTSGLEYEDFDNPKLKNNLFSADGVSPMPLIANKPEPSSGKPQVPEVEETSDEPAASVTKALEILSESEIEVEDEPVKLDEFLRANFDLIEKPKARRSDYDSFKIEIQSAIAGLTMSQGGGVRVTGRPGTGKTYFMETLASYLLENRPEPTLYLNFSASTLIAGDGVVGPTERKIKALKMAAQKVKVVLLIDEVHTLVGAGRYKGNDVDFFQHIKTELAGGQIKIVGTTTDHEWEQAFSGDQALSERFPINIKIDEPPDDKVLQILANFQQRESGERQVKVAADLMHQILEISKQYDPVGANPRKSIRLLDFSLSMAHVEKLSSLNRDKLVQYASQLYGYDIRELETERIRQRLTNLGTYLDSVLVGMKAAKARIARALGSHFFSQFDRSISARPFGVLLYGKRGVGKTAMATHVAKGLGFGFTKIMMAEYATPHSVENFKSRLALAIRTNPYSVILLDEIEKADESVQRVLLQVMDEARFHAKLSESYGATGSAGAEVDASKTLFVMTTNAGQDMAAENVTSVRFQDEAEADGLNAYLLDRIGEFIPLGNPNADEVREIVKFKWEQYKQSLRTRGLSLNADDGALVNSIVTSVMSAEYQRQQAHTIGMTPHRRTGDDLVLSVRELERRVGDIAQDVANYFLQNPKVKSADVELKDGRVHVSPTACEKLLTGKGKR